MTPRALLFLLIAAASGVQAENAATIAVLVNEPAPDAARLAAAAADPDALVRATAARVVTARGVLAALPALHKALAAEKNADAAREQVRALALLGSDEEVAFAASRLAAFPASIDGDFAEAVARRGAPHATALYLKHRAQLRRTVLPSRFALWGRSPLAAATASRLVAASDVQSLGALFHAMLDSHAELDEGVVIAALTSPAAEMRTQTLWYVVNRYGDSTTAAPDRIRKAADTSPDPEPGPQESFVRDVMRRIGGGEAGRVAAWLPWLSSNEGRATVPNNRMLRRFLTPEEQMAVWGDRKPDAELDARDAIAETAFTLPLRLPAGLGSKLVSHLDCRGPWVGVASATVDRTGRVTAADLKDVYTSEACRSVLGTMLKMSFAEPSSILAPLQSNQLQVVDGGGEPCVDEDAVDDAAGRGSVRLARDVVPPVAVLRSEPVFPDAVRAKITEPAVVVAQASISRSGCVRGVRIVKQSEFGELNSSAALALSKWNFKPATLDGSPVDATITITFRFKAGT